MHSEITCRLSCAPWTRLQQRLNGSCRVHHPGVQLLTAVVNLTEILESHSVCSFCQQKFTRRDALKRHWGICKVRLEAGLEIPLLPARRSRLKKPRACNRCVRLKRACNRGAPCSTCSAARNYECSYERVASSNSSEASQAETNSVSQQEISGGIEKATDAMPVISTDFIDYSPQWLQCESLPFTFPDLDVWNNIRGSGLHVDPCFGQTDPGRKLTLPFLKRFTDSSNIADGFDCGSLAQRRQLNEAFDDSFYQYLTSKTREIILRLFWSGWYPNSPIIHKPTFNVKAESPGLIASMAVLGACLSPDTDDCVRAMAWLTPVEEAVFADDILYDDSIVASPSLFGDEAIVSDKLKALHAAFFICIAQNWEGSKEGRQCVRKDRYSRVASIARSFGLYNLSLEKLDTTFPTQQKWARFILLESMIRPEHFSQPQSLNMFTIITALCCLVFQYQTTLVDASQVTPAATGLNRWIWLWQQGDHTVINPDDYLVENMWKRVGFMQHANEFYHLGCAMLERWKLTEQQIGDTLAALAVPLGLVQDNTKYDDGEMVQVKALIHDLENPRHRKGIPKSRTGCMTCRIRKIKCDEARPGCQRCISTGRKCVGYGDMDSVTRQALIIRERPPITRVLNNDLGIELSTQAFDYYRGHVSRQIGDTVDSDFWGNLVLRLAPTDPAIRHAISAISLMYAEKTKDARDTSPNYRPAIIEYNKAILAVRSWPLATESRVKPLLVCLLFVYEHQNAAKMHILQGRRLLANIKDYKTPQTDIIRQYLAPIYLRLAYVGHDRVDFPRHLLQMTTTPLKFASLADARCILYYLVDIGFTLIYEVKSYRSNGVKEETSDSKGDTLQSTQKQIIRELANWRHAFEAYLAFSDLDARDTRTAKLLTQRHCLMIVFLDSMVSGSDYVCDRNSLCEMSIATDCANFVVKYDNDVMQGPSFTFESEVVGPLF
ncbi:hypothetical protein FGADI_3507 [Fusarium gaditjirri]|uniref:Zn(2)-C6 fungal-type domain-containing protein n=1 Tax=Fusarium gaditjirri TaxID=282569 RepID=A0A8H4TFG8_9HYPO|nr:hypothetical protein FGADI_3507 [Fusarium gaditjirri]